MKKKKSQNLEARKKKKSKQIDASQEIDHCAIILKELVDRYEVSAHGEFPFISVTNRLQRSVVGVSPDSHQNVK